MRSVRSALRDPPKVAQGSRTTLRVSAKSDAAVGARFCARACLCAAAVDPRSLLPAEHGASVAPRDGSEGRREHRETRMESVEHATGRVVCWRGLAELEPQVRAFARRRCRDVHELDDVVQETLLRAARYRSGLQDEARLRSWTLRIAANVVRDRKSRDTLLCFLDPEGEELARLPGNEVDPGAAGEWMRLTEYGVVMERDSLVAHVSQVIEELPSADARVLRSYYSEPISAARAASECGVAGALVKTRLHRARKRLRRRLSLVLELIPWVERCACAPALKESP